MDATAPILRNWVGDAFRLWATAWLTGGELLLNCGSRHGIASSAILRGRGGRVKLHQGRGKASSRAALAHPANSQPGRGTGRAPAEPGKKPGFADRRGTKLFGRCQALGRAKPGKRAGRAAAQPGRNRPTEAGLAVQV